MTTLVLLEVSQVDTNYMQAALGSPSPLLTPPLRFWLPQSTSTYPVPFLAHAAMPGSSIPLPTPLSLLEN